jgi:hypothetical protein
LKYAGFAVVRNVMPKTKQEIEAIINSETTQNLISIRDDLWSGEKTRQQIEDELREALEEGNDEE